MRINWLSSAVVLSTLCVSAWADSRINFDWRFRHENDIKQSGSNVEEAVRAETDDSGWETVDLPHDFAISGPFGGPSDSGEQGKLPWKGVGIYRKHFDLPVEGAGKRLILAFDGVRASPRVWLNSIEVGSWRYGYNSFHVDATDAAIFGGGNVLAVVANAGSQSSRWYPGAGIFRKVNMLLKEQVHIPVWGVYVTTPDVSDVKGALNVSVEVVNKGGKPSQIWAVSTCLSPKGEKVASGRSKSVTIGPGKLEMLNVAMTVANPLRWDVIHPRLYRVVTTLSIDGAAAVTNTVHTGFRTFKVTADDGFILNGRRLQLQGVNLHHDHGPLGAAFFPRAMERQLEIMKEMGVNAIRTSHNMPAPELLDLCDRMGFVVYDEAFDAWSLSYVKNEAEAELRNFVRRDRNHPSVFFWSVGNEVRQKCDGEANRLLRSYVLRHDKTRNVSQGFCTPHLATTEKGILGELDSSGWNYGSRYAEARKNYPDKPLLYTETASAFGTRGAYKLRLPLKKTDYAADGECNAHVLTSARWSDIPEVEFERVLRDKFLLGEFVWTGFDYLGEPTPYNGPQIDQKHGRTGRSSYFGIVDLAGLPKDSYYLYRSHWRPEVTTVYVAPHWNWEGHEGTMIPVFGYTNGDEGELFVNGKSMGRQKKEPLKDNLSTGKPAQAGSEDPRLNNLRCDGAAGNAVDDNKLSDWRPAHGEELPQWWMADLQKAQRFNHIRILWASRAEEQKFKVETSMDAVTWEKKEHARRQDHNAECNVTFATITARHVRITVTKGNPAIRDVKVISNIDTHHFRNSIDDYYDVVGKYRLFWDNVPYEPGELKFVAYKGGKVMGEHVRKTAGRPARLRLAADRQQITADGMDLCYVTIEMTDRNGVVCPRAMDDVAFDVEGPARLMGVANGNQMGLDSFTDPTHPLFYGKAVAVLRSRPGQSGDVTLKVKTTTGEIHSSITIRASALSK